MADILHMQWILTSPLEMVAAGFAVAYLLLAIRQSIWCWPCAFVSTALYIYLFQDVALYMESALNLFYLLMAVYGFWYWRSGGSQAASGARVITLSPRTHVLAIAAIAIAVVLSGYLLKRYTSQAMPFTDSATTFAAVWATWLTARKVLESWLWWLVIDALSIYLYLSRGLPLTALLFAGYIVMIPFGFLAWRRDLRQTPSALTA